MKHTFILFLFLVLLCNHAFAQGNKIQIINANSLEIDNRLGQKVKKMIGAVQLKQDNTLLYCDSAYLFDETNYVEAYHNVRINHNDSVNFYGDILKYDGATKIARLERNVSMVDPNTRLTCDALEFNLQQGRAYYSNGGRIISGDNLLTSKSGYYFTASKEMFFKNNVRLTGKEFNISCDTLRYQTRTKTAIFQGKTIIVSSTDTVYTKSGTYHTEKQNGVLTQRAMVRSEENTLIADTIYYDRPKKYTRALGNVVIIDTVNKTTIFGGIAELKGKEKISYVTKNPIILSLVDKDTMQIAADTIYSIQVGLNKKQDQLHAYKHVKIFKSDLQAVADSLVYIKQDSCMSLYKQPVMWSENNQITGDTILFYMNNQKLDSMQINSNAFVISSETPKHFNQIKGRNMKAYFVNGKIDYISVFGNGQSIYYAKDDSLYIGVNVIDCSEMTFKFSIGKMQKASFITKPEATFYPLDELKPEQLRLKGFRWDVKRKPKTMKINQIKFP